MDGLSVDAHTTNVIQDLEAKLNEFDGQKQDDPAATECLFDQTADLRIDHVNISSNASMLYEAKMKNAPTIITLDGSFGSTPISFGDVTMEDAVKRELVVSNPTSNEQIVTISRFPFQKGFSLWRCNDNARLDPVLFNDDNSTFAIEPNTNICFILEFKAPITDVPKAYRHVVNLANGKRAYKLSLEAISQLGKQKQETFKRTIKLSRMNRKPLHTFNRQPSLKFQKSTKLTASTTVQSHPLLKSQTTKDISQQNGSNLVSKSKSDTTPSSVHKGILNKGSEKPDTNSINKDKNNPTQQSSQERAFTTWLNHILVPDTGKNMYTNRENLKLRSKAQAIVASSAMQDSLRKLHESIQNGKILAKEESIIYQDVHLRDEIMRIFLSFHPAWLQFGLETLFREEIDNDQSCPIPSLKSFILKRVLDSSEIKKEFCYPHVPTQRQSLYHAALSNHILYHMLAILYILDQFRSRDMIPHRQCLFLPATFQSTRGVLAHISNHLLKGEGSLEKHLRYLGFTFSYEQTSLDEYDFEVTNLSTDLRDGVRLWKVLTHYNARNVNYSPAVTQSSDVWLKNNQQLISTFKNVGCKQIFPQRSAQDLTNGHRDVTLSILWALMVNFHVCSPIDAQRLQDEITRVKKDPRYKPFCNRRTSDADMYQHSTESSLLLHWCRAVCACFRLEITDFTRSFSDGRALCYLISYYHPQLLPSQAIKTMTTITAPRENGYDLQMEVIKASTSGFSCSMSPGVSKLGGRTRQQLLENEKRNYRLISDSLKVLGGVPLLAKCKDLSNTQPDERVVLSYVSCLCVRLLDINQERRACSVIQHHWRQFKKKQAQQLAARKIQVWWRACKLMKVQKAKYECCQCAIWTLQRVIRGVLARKQTLKLQNAIVTFQKHIRRWLCKRTLRALRQQYFMSMNLQSICRGFMGRLDVSRHLQERKQHRAVTCIHRHILMWHVRKIHRKRNNAATILQSAFRGYCDRKRAEQRKFAIAVLQSRIRAWCTGQHVRNDYINVLSAVRTLQLAVRSWSSRKATQGMCLKRRIAATQIQAIWRMYACKNSYNQVKKATLRIQCQTRMLHAKRQLAHLKTYNATASLLQAVIRGFVARIKFSQLKSILNQQRAARTIQRCYHGWKSRQEYQQKMKSIQSIQAFTRGWIARKRVRAIMHKINFLQQNVRSWIIGRSVRARFLELKKATILLQRLWRSKLVVSQTRQLCLQRHHAAIIVQSWWRMKLQRKFFQQQKNTVIVLQSYFRKYIAQVKLRHLKYRQEVIHSFVQATRCFCAAIVIQRSWKKHLKCQQAACRLQAAVKSWCVRRSYQRTKAAICQIQCHVRGWIARKVYLSYRQQRISALVQATVSWCAAVRLQRAFRCYFQRRQAVVTLQSAAKGWMARNQLQKKHSAIACLQSSWRCMQARRLVKKLRAHQAYRINLLVCCAKMECAAISIQRWYKSCQMNNKKLQAAIVIQKYVRRWLSKNGQACRDEAATRIQGAYRAYRTRKQMSARLRKIHQNLVAVNKAYCPEATLRWKTDSALTVLLKYKKVSRVLEALRNLSRMASLTVESCVHIASHNGLEVIYTLTRSCNRSKPEMAMVVCCLEIISELMRHNETRARVMENLQLGELMFDLTRGYRDNADIFAPSCRLLHFCCQDARHRAHLQQDHSYMKRLKSLINLTERKAAIISKAKAALNKNETDSSPSLVQLLKEVLQHLEEQTP